MRSIHATACAVALLALAGCAREPLRPAPPPAPVTPPSGEGIARDEPRARYGNPPFYDVAGRRYVVLQSAVGFVEQGVASWYGPDFHGGRTATGETYDMHAMTGAHPTLPLPTWVRVTNLENGRSVVVRLNDRGPFARDRIIDLSRAAAEALAGRLRDAGIEGVTVSESQAGRGPVYRVRAGPAASLPDFDRLVERMLAAGAEAVRLAL